MCLKLLSGENSMRKILTLTLILLAVLLMSVPVAIADEQSAGEARTECEAFREAATDMRVEALQELSAVTQEINTYNVTNRDHMHADEKSEAGTLFSDGIYCKNVGNGFFTEGQGYYGTASPKAGAEGTYWTGVYHWNLQNYGLAEQAFNTAASGFGDADGSFDFALCDYQQAHEAVGLANSLVSDSFYDDPDQCQASNCTCPRCEMCGELVGFCTCEE
jgi:hypothetical protein